MLTHQKTKELMKVSFNTDRRNDKGENKGRTIRALLCKKKRDSEMKVQ